MTEAIYLSLASPFHAVDLIPAGTCPNKVCIAQLVYETPTVTLGKFVGLKGTSEDAFISAGELDIHLPTQPLGLRLSPISVASASVG